MNKTKIVATIGPASSSKETLKKLIKAGMNVARINLDYADYDFCTDVVNKIKELNEELKTSVATMFDTRGHDVRVGTFVGGSAILEENTKIRIYMNDIIGDSAKFSINYPGLLEEINYDAIIKIADGHISLKVIDKGEDYLLCQVLNGGIIKDNKGVNIPGFNYNIPFISKQDRDDILLANTLGVDFLALSFTNGHEDVLEVNDMLIDMGNDHIEISLVSKDGSVISSNYGDPHDRNHCDYHQYSHEVNATREH